MDNADNITKRPVGRPRKPVSLEPKRPVGRPRKPVSTDPKRPVGRPKVSWALLQAQAVADDPVSEEDNYQLALASITRQRIQIECLADALYETMQATIDAGGRVDKAQYDTYEKYQARLRHLNNDIIELRKTRLEERKIEQQLREQASSRITAININYAAPPPPVQPPYNEQDYIKKPEEEDAEAAPTQDETPVNG